MKRKILGTIVAASMLLSAFGSMIAFAEGSVNLITNSSFEDVTGTNVPIDWTLNSKASVAGDHIASGSKSIKLIDTGMATKKLSLSSNQDYRVSVWAYSVVKSWFQVQIYYYDGPLVDGNTTGTQIGTFTTLIDNNATTAGAWLYFAKNFTSPYGTKSAKIDFRTRTVGHEIHIDDAILSVIGDEKVNNGSFEELGPNNVITSWAMNTGVSLNSIDKIDGNYSLQLEADGNAVTQQLVVLKPNTEYVLSGWYNNVTGGGITKPYVKIEFYSTATGTGSTGQKEYWLDTSITGWKYIEERFTTPESTISGIFYLRKTTAGTVLYDAFSIKNDKSFISFIGSDEAPLENIKSDTITVNYHHVNDRAKNSEGVIPDENIIMITGLYSKQGENLLKLESLAQIENATVVNGTINPLGNTTRAEAAVIMYRILNK